MSFSRPSTPCSSISIPSVINTSGSRDAFVYHHRDDDDANVESSPPETPRHSFMSLLPPSTPMAPRPRKRVYDCQPTDVIMFAENDLFLPTAEQLQNYLETEAQQGQPNEEEKKEEEEEDVVNLSYVPETPPPTKRSFHLTRRPAPPRIERYRKVARSVNSVLALAPTLNDLDLRDDDVSSRATSPNPPLRSAPDVVRLVYRPTLSPDDYDIFGHGSHSSSSSSSSSSHDIPKDHQALSLQWPKLTTSLPQSQRPKLSLKRRNSCGAMCA